MNKQLKILIADDNRESKEKIISHFEKNEKYNLLTVQSSLEIIDKIKNDCPDVVVMDVILAGKDGFTILEELKREGVNTKVIITTSLTSDTFVAKAMSLGVSYYMIKPYNIQTLENRISELLTNNVSINNSELSFSFSFIYLQLSMPNLISL